MKKFEVGKIYVDFQHYGLGYDECLYAHYYLIERKSDKFIWVKHTYRILIYYAIDYMDKEEAINIDPAKLKFGDIKRLKLNIDNNNNEYFIFTDKNSNINDWVFSEYCKEVGGNK